MNEQRRGWMLICVPCARDMHVETQGHKCGRKLCVRECVGESLCLFLSCMLRSEICNLVCKHTCKKYALLHTLHTFYTHTHLETYLKPVFQLILQHSVTLLSSLVWTDVSVVRQLADDN